LDRQHHQLSGIIGQQEQQRIGDERENSNPNTTTTIGEQSGVKVETGRTRGGKEFVRVYGSKEAAEDVKKGFQSEGKEPGPVNRDKYRQGVWYFYL